MPEFSEALVVDLALDTRNFEKGIVRAERGVGHFTKSTDRSTKRVGRGFKSVTTSVVDFTAKLGLALNAVRGLARSVSGVVTEFTSFERAFAQVTTLFEGTPQQIAGLRQGLEELSVRFGIDVKDAAASAYQAISAGVEPARVLQFLTTAAEGAAAGATTLRSQTELLVDVLNAYGLEADQARRVSDVLFKTIKVGRTTAEEMSRAFGDVTPVARSAGVSLQEIAAALASTTLVLGNTSKSVTGLRSVISTIVGPSVEAKRAFDAMGVSAASLRREGFIATLRRIREATGGAAERIAALFPQESRATLAALIDNLDALDNSMNEIGDSAGATRRSFLKMSRTGEMNFRRLKQFALRVAREIGERFTKFAGDAIDDLGGMELALLKLTRILNQIKLVAVATSGVFRVGFRVAGEVVTAILGKLAGALSVIVAGARRAAEAFRLRGTAASLRTVENQLKATAAAGSFTGFVSAMQRINASTAGFRNRLNEANRSLAITNSEIQRLEARRRQNAGREVADRQRANALTQAGAARERERQAAIRGSATEAARLTQRLADANRTAQDGLNVLQRYLQTIRETQRGFADIQTERVTAAGFGEAPLAAGAGGVRQAAFQAAVPRAAGTTTNNTNVNVTVQAQEGGDLRAQARAMIPELERALRRVQQPGGGQ